MDVQWFAIQSCWPLMSQMPEDHSPYTSQSNNGAKGQTEQAQSGFIAMGCVLPTQFAFKSFAF